MLTPLNPGAVRHRGMSVTAPPEISPVKVGDRLFLFDALSLDICRATPELVSAFASAPESAVGLRRKPVFPPPPENFPRASLLVMNLTYACNLRCAYCFVRESKNTAAPASLTFDQAREAIKLLFPDREKPARIGFFGGEPLVAWDTLMQVVEFAEREYQNVRWSITTNGTLLDEEKVSFLEKLKGRLSLIVSLDGNPARHNRLRPLAGGGDSFAATLAGLRKLAAAGFRPTLRSTFESGGCSLAEELEFLNQLCDEGLASHVSLEPVSLTEGCHFASHAITPEQMRALEPEYLAAADWFISRARDGKRARFHHIYKMLERLLQKIPQPSECGAGKGYLCLSPNGELHACHREKSPVGKIENGTVEWFGEREQWRDNRFDARQSCPTCPLRYLCGGGCRQDSVDRYGDTRKPSPLNCVLTELRFKMAVKILDEIGPESAAKTAGIKYGRG